MTIFSTWLPVVNHEYPALKDLFGERGIVFGMAGEGYSFDSSPLIVEHAASMTAECSMKMGRIQAVKDVWDYAYGDALVAKCLAHSIDLHGHCAIWHIQNPTWLNETLAGVSKTEGYDIMFRHVKNLMMHYKDLCKGFDVVNEYGAVGEGLGWGLYLGRECVQFAYKTAREYCGSMKLYYNSFFDSDVDIDLAIGLLPLVDGIGIQLHLVCGEDVDARFSKLRRLIDACKVDGKLVRFSECTVLKTPVGTLEDVAELWGRIVRFALEFPKVVVALTQWGVKYPAWGYRHVLLDRDGNYTLAFKSVVTELNR